MIRLAPLLMLLAAGCSSDSDPGPGGVTKGEARLLDAAALIEKFGPLVGDDDFGPRVRFQMRLYLIGQVMDVDDSARDASGSETI